MRTEPGCTRLAALRSVEGVGALGWHTSLSTRMKKGGRPDTHSAELNRLAAPRNRADLRPEAAALSWKLMKSQGMQEDQQVMFLSDGDDDVRQVQEYLHPFSEQITDWFHITMKSRCSSSGPIWAESEPGSGATFTLTLLPVPRAQRPREWYAKSLRIRAVGARWCDGGPGPLPEAQPSPYAREERAADER